MPALPLGEAGKYVAAAYLVFLALVLIYVSIMAIRLATVQRDVEELATLMEREKEPVGASCCCSGPPTRPRRWRCASAWR